MLVTPSHIYRKYHISTHFLDKNHLLSFSAQRKNIIFSGKINTIFPDITKKIVFRHEFPGKTIFPEHLKKIWYFQVFFWEKSSFFLCLRIRLYFREKEILSFLIIQERSYSSAIYLERPCFQNIWKKKIWFFVQWLLSSSLYNSAVGLWLFIESLKYGLITLRYFNHFYSLGDKFSYLSPVLLYSM